MSNKNSPLKNIMTKTFFFYDLETTGTNPSVDRIMQFAGQRTDLELNPIGEPYNFLLKLNDDVLPHPLALRVTGITPQKTLEEGYSEAEAVKILTEEIWTPETIAIGFNNVSFDDEFMRYLFWRNYVDPYSWTYAEGCSRWDVLGVIRLIRALRPDGFKWPVDSEGKSSVKLELLSKANNLNQIKAHDALSDVTALIDLAKMIQQKQPKLWQYLFSMREKKQVATLIDPQRPQPFVYNDFRLPLDNQRTSVFYPIGNTEFQVLAYNLMQDPTPLIGCDLAKIEAFFEKLATNQEVYNPYLLEIKLNRCPTVAPLGVIRDEDAKRIKLDLKLIKKHLQILRQNPKLMIALTEYFKHKADNYQFEPKKLPEEQLYDGFISNTDRLLSDQIINFNKQQIIDFIPKFNDRRLNEIWLGYKARSFSQLLNDTEKDSWEQIRIERINQQLPNFLEELKVLEADPSGNEFLIEELKLWLELLAFDQN